MLDSLMARVWARVVVVAALSLTTVAVTTSSGVAGAAPAAPAAIPAASLAYVPLVPARVLDTRPGEATVDGQSSGGGPLVATGGPPDPVVPATRNVGIGGRGGVPTTGVAAVVLNVTALDASQQTVIKL